MFAAAPGVDLTAISARSVRRTIVAGDPSVGADWIKANKEGIDKLIAEVFNNVAVNVGAHNTPVKRKREDDGDTKATGLNGNTKSSHGHPSSSSVSSTPFPPSQQPISHYASNSSHHERPATPEYTKQELDDAAYARQLASELNATAGRTTRGGSSNGHHHSSATSSKKRAASGKKKSKVKSPSKIVDSEDDSGSGSGDDDDDDGEDSAPAKKKTRTKAKPKRGDGEAKTSKGGFQKEFGLSNALSAVCDDAQQMSRPQVVSNLWKYIKVCLES